MPKKLVKKGKKAVAKKTITKVAKKVSMPKKGSCGMKSLDVKAPLGKTQLITSLAEMVCLGKKEVAMTLEALSGVIASHLKKRGPGEFTLPGIAKFRVINKPATRARQGINPFTGQPMTYAAKPARNVVKMRVLKKLKDLVK